MVDSYVANEWSFIPHFYNDYYVFQYATSFTASSALSEKVLSRRRRGHEKILDVYFSGRSKYPIDLLKDAGRRHDNRRAAGTDHAEDEPGDGRDGEGAGPSGEVREYKRSFASPGLGLRGNDLASAWQ